MKALSIIALVLAAVVAGAFGLIAAAAGKSDAAPSSGLRGVPEAFRPWLLKASDECRHRELTPALLAAQVQQESGFSTSRTTVSPDGAQGPAQFMPGTWSTWGRDADGNGTADPFDSGDAVTAQGRMMCSLIGQAKTSGISGDTRSLALAAYNAGWGAVEQHRGIPPYTETQNYVRTILATMKQFQATESFTVSGNGPGPDALRKASTQLGVPYAWGGGGAGGPSTGFCDGTNGYDRNTGECLADRTVGFDCSGLTQYAYWPAAKLPRTAHTQYNATAHTPVARADLREGDLLFWSNASGIYHVAIYAGDGNVLHAPRTGKNVRIEPMANAMPASDYHGATRP